MIRRMTIGVVPALMLAALVAAACWAQGTVPATSSTTVPAPAAKATAPVTPTPVATLPKPAAEAGKVAVITLGGAHHWTDKDYALNKACDFLDLLGMNKSVTNIQRVVEIILSHIRDLFAIPPLPGAGTVVVADATITGEDGRTRHAEIVRSLEALRAAAPGRSS